MKPRIPNSNLILDLTSFKEHIFSSYEYFIYFVCLFTELKDVRANTPLHYATQSGDREIVASLIRHGANPNAVGERGYTPLHISVSTI